MSSMTIADQIKTIELMGNRLDIAQRILDIHYKEVVSFLACMPFPAWIKNSESRMIYINPAYERAYGVTVEEYNSKLDAEMWDMSSASALYLSNDQQVMSSGTHLRTTEQFVGDDGVSHSINVVKWPLIVQDGPVSVAGIAVIEI